MRLTLYKYNRSKKLHKKENEIGKVPTEMAYSLFIQTCQIFKQTMTTCVLFSRSNQILYKYHQYTIK